MHPAFLHDAQTDVWALRPAASTTCASTSSNDPQVHCELPNTPGVQEHFSVTLYGRPSGIPW